MKFQRQFNRKMTATEYAKLRVVISPDMGQELRWREGNDLGLLWSARSYGFVALNQR